jgi:hypothetical protein
MTAGSRSAVAADLRGSGRARVRNVVFVGPLAPHLGGSIAVPVGWTEPG